MIVFLYILLVILILAALYGLFLLFVKLMNRYGPGLTRRFGSEKKKKEVKIQLNNGCLIIAFILFFIAIMPGTNRMLFLTMAALFAVRAFNGKMSVPRGIALFFGSFLVGSFVTSILYGILKPLLAVIFLILSIPLLILGFIRSK